MTTGAAVLPIRAATGDVDATIRALAVLQRAGENVAGDYKRLLARDDLSAAQRRVVLALLAKKDAVTWDDVIDLDYD